MMQNLFSKQVDGALVLSRRIHSRVFLSRFEKIGPYLFIVIPGIFYYLTACRTPGWVDSTLIVSNVVSLKLGSWANYHNLFHILGYAWLQLFPDHNIHFYLVLLSALFGALTVQLMFLVFLEITSHRIVAVLGALILMLSHSLWWHSTMLEVYTLNSAILAATLLFLIRYNKTERFMNLCAAAFFLGLGCSNHVLMVLFAFGFLAVLGLLMYRRKNLTFWKVMILIGCFLLGTGLYFIVFIQDYHNFVRRIFIQEPSLSHLEVRVAALRKILDYSTGSEFKKYMFPSNVSPGEKRFWRVNYLILIIYNYPSSAILLALFGFYCFWKRKTLRLTFLFFILGLISQIIWSGNYFIWDMYAFALPVYVLLSVPVVFAMHFLLKRGRVGRIILLLMLPTFFAPPFIYKAVSDDGRKEGVVKNYFKNYPEWEQAEDTWDVVEYLTNPNKRNYAKVPEYADRILEILPHEAHLWNSVGRADYPLRLYYRDIYGRRTDIKHHSLFNPFMSHEEAEREAKKMKANIDLGLPVYTASLNFPERLVLAHLYVLMDPGKDLQWVSGLPLDRFIGTFPGIEFEEIVLIEQERRSIYRVVLREIALEARSSAGAGHGETVALD